jgi:hypothetical protein
VEINFPDLEAIASQFQVTGNWLGAVPHGSGHINDTYLARRQNGLGEAPFILQRINHHVFKQPEKLMENVERVTTYARQRIIETGGDPQRQVLNLIPTCQGSSYMITPQGEYWRAYTFIAGAHSYDRPENLRQVTTAARAFGDFQKLLADLPGGRLNETIPDFHNTPRRLAAFQSAVQADAAGRAAQVQPEIDFVLRRQADAGVVVDLLASGALPERVTHNDTKLNNVLIDDLTGEGICVIDLDTVMPGSLLYDFGDLVRMGAATAAEDEPDLDKVGLDLALFAALAQGYLEATGDFLTPLERELLRLGGA